jgi:hypothetical protein
MINNSRSFRTRVMIINSRSFRMRVVIINNRCFRTRVVGCFRLISNITRIIINNDSWYCSTSC